VAVGDFNGDGKQDLALANETSSGTVSVLLGKGDGTFLPAQAFPAGSNPRSVAVGDFNGDGKLDLAVANYNLSGSVSVLLGNGDGTFQAAVNYAAGTRPQSVAVGDFNGDGIPDLAVANYGDLNGNGQGVSVLLGKGDGTFLPAQAFSAGIHPSSVAVGDFKGDGHPDLAVANYYGGVSVLLGQGDGTFLPAQSLYAGAGPRSVAVGDFNGDGRLDLVVANYNSHNVSVLLGNGDGTFQPAVNYATGDGFPISVAVGHFNGDGKLDLAVADYGLSISFGNSGIYSGVHVLLGNGDGTFQTAYTYYAGIHPTSVAVGDFNGDGKQDLAVASYWSSNVSVLLGNGDGTFLTAKSYTAGVYPRSVAVGDFNGDGKLDLAVAGYTQGEFSYGTVSVLLGQGDGTFQAAYTLDAGDHPSSVAVGDFNGDGKLDLAVTDFGDDYGNGQGVSVLLGKGDGTFLPPQSYAAGSRPLSVAVGDFNGDGILDLAVADYGTWPYTNGSVSVLLGKGDGTFLPAVNYAAEAWPRSVAVGDFNGDGKQDLAVTNLYGTVVVLPGNGDGTFQPAMYYGGAWGSGAVGDFNGDGKPDLAVANYGDWLAKGQGVRVLLGNGDGTFQTTNFSYVAGNDPVSVAVGDFNGDGFPDLAVANYWSNDVSILLNDATWPAGPGRARGGPSDPPVPQPLPPPAVVALASGEQPRLAASALLTLATPSGSGPALTLPAPLALPGADPPRPMILAVLLAEQGPAVLADPRTAPRARGAPGEALGQLFAELAANGIWDDRTDEGIPLLG
jgi:hypothetical protein